MIMPLANRRDKETQVIWGIKDFEYRFGRKPKGLWLPEAAVDTETLQIMAELGIKFTVLAPGQVKRVRKIKKGTKMERAKEVGIALGKLALEKGIKKCVFDRGGYKYHGRVRKIAEGARESGLKF